MKRKVAYGVLVLLTLFVAVTREAQFPRFLLAYELLFAAAMAMWVRWIVRKLKISLELSQGTIIRGERVSVKVHAKNPTWFPVGEIAVELVLRDMSRECADTAEESTGKKVKRRRGRQSDGVAAAFGRRISAYMGADSRGTDTWQVDVIPVHCGLLGVEIVQVRVSDYIGLWSARVREPFSGKSVSVLPRIRTLESEEEVHFAGKQEGTQEIVMARAGEDTQEIFDTRLYQRGDTLRTVHWKLSAKESDLIVKEFGMPVERGFLIAADSSMEAPEKAEAKQMDELLDMTASLAAHLLDNGQACELVWYSDREEELHVCSVREEASLYRALEELLEMRPCWDGQVLTSYLEAQEPSGEPLRVTIGGKVFQGDRETAIRLSGE